MLPGNQCGRISGEQLTLACSCTAARHWPMDIPHLPRYEQMQLHFGRYDMVIALYVHDQNQNSLQRLRQLQS